MRFLQSQSCLFKINRFLRIGCSSGFWGDTGVSFGQLVQNGSLQYIVADYLSEITMSLLASVRLKRPELGFVPDFLGVGGIQPFLKEVAQRNIKVITNAGGVNPMGCGVLLKEMIEKAGIPLRVAVVDGDDVLTVMREKGIKDLEDWEPVKGLSNIPEQIQDVSKLSSANIYQGCQGIAQALSSGADIVICGRVTDSSLVLGPFVHEFDLDLGPSADPDLARVQLKHLATGSCAGHLIECGAQVTGGNMTDWHEYSEGWHDIGFPIVEFESPSSFVITKPQKTGGSVNKKTVSEQLLYEISDPSKYILPDVTCDFSNVILTETRDSLGEKAVKIDNVGGFEPPASDKVCFTVVQGWRATAVAPVVGPRSSEKAHAVAAAILKRVNMVIREMALAPIEKFHVQFLGDGGSFGTRNLATRDGLLWLAVEHEDRRVLEVFAREIAPAGTGMAPGLTTLIGGRPTPSAIHRLFSLDIPRHLLPKPKSTCLFEPFDAKKNIKNKNDKKNKKMISADPVAPKRMGIPGLNYQLFFDLLKRSAGSGFRLEEIAFARSGDKGDSCNIGVIARRPEFYPVLLRVLTREIVLNVFEHLIVPVGQVAKIECIDRFEAGGVCGLNFVLRYSLGGGGVGSLRPDPQGKAYGQMLLDTWLEVKETDF